MNKAKRAVGKLLSNRGVVLLTLLSWLVSFGYCGLMFSEESDISRMNDYSGGMSIAANMFGMLTVFAINMIHEEFEKKLKTINVLPVKKETAVNIFIDSSAVVYGVQNLFYIAFCILVFAMGKINSVQLASILVNFVFFLMVSMMIVCAYTLVCRSVSNKMAALSLFWVVMCIVLALKGKLDSNIITRQDNTVYLTVISILALLSTAAFVLVRNKTAKVFY